MRFFSVLCLSLALALLVLTISTAQEKEQKKEVDTAKRKVPVSTCGKCGWWKVGTAPLKCPECKATRDNFKDGEKEIKVGPELVPNFGFEKGTSTPDGWDDVDDLTTFHVKRPDGKGKCLKCDSDVYEKEVAVRREEMKKSRDKRPKATPKTPTSGKKYNTVAGGKGALLWSDYIDVEPGAEYMLSAEVNTYAPEVFVYIKGYTEHKGERRIIYKGRLVCKPEDKNELGQWKYYYRQFTPENPHNKKLQVKWVKVMLMIFWPPGEAYLDNISIRKILEPGKNEEKPKEKVQEPEEEKKEDKPEGKKE